MEYKIRQMYPNEYPYLKEFLYEAIFQKAHGEPSAKGNHQ